MQRRAAVSLRPERSNRRNRDAAPPPPSASEGAKSALAGGYRRQSRSASVGLVKRSMSSQDPAEDRGNSASDVEALEIEIDDAEKQVTALEAPAKGDELGITDVDVLKRSFALMTRFEELAAESLERGCQRKKGAMEVFHKSLGLIDRLSVSMEKNNRSPNREPAGAEQNEGFACENENIGGAGEMLASLVEEVPADAIAMDTARPGTSIACVSTGSDAMVLTAGRAVEVESIVCSIAWAGGYAAGLLNPRSIVYGIGWTLGFATGLTGRVHADASRYVRRHAGGQLADVEDAD